MPLETLDLRYVENLTNIDSDRVKYVPKQKTKNPLWRQFKLVYVDGQPSDFVICDPCRKLYRYHSRQGSSHLSRHARKCSIGPDFVDTLNVSYELLNNDSASCGNYADASLDISNIPRQSHFNLKDIKSRLQQELIKFIAAELVPKESNAPKQVKYENDVCEDGSSYVNTTIIAQYRSVLTTIVDNLEKEAEAREDISNLYEVDMKEEINDVDIRYNAHENNLDQRKRRRVEEEEEEENVEPDNLKMLRRNKLQLEIENLKMSNYNLQLDLYEKEKRLGLLHSQYTQNLVVEDLG